MPSPFQASVGCTDLHATLSVAGNDDHLALERPKLPRGRHQHKARAVGDHRVEHPSGPTFTRPRKRSGTEARNCSRVRAAISSPTARRSNARSLASLRGSSAATPRPRSTSRRRSSATPTSAPKPQRASVRPSTSSSQTGPRCRGVASSEGRSGPTQERAWEMRAEVSTPVRQDPSSDSLSVGSAAIRARYWIASNFTAGDSREPGKT